MWLSALLLASLVCTGHGRRQQISEPVDGLSAIKQPDPKGERSFIPDALAVLRHSKWSRLDRTLAMLLLALKPVAPFQVTGQALGVTASDSRNHCVSSPCRSRPGYSAEMFFSVPPSPSEGKADPWKNLRLVRQRISGSPPSDAPQDQEEKEALGSPLEEVEPLPDSTQEQEKTATADSSLDEAKQLPLEKDAESEDEESSALPQDKVNEGETLEKAPEKKEDGSESSAKSFFSIPPAPADGKADPWKNLRFIQQRLSGSPPPDPLLDADNELMLDKGSQESPDLPEDEIVEVSDSVQDDEEEISSQEALEKLVSDLIVDIPQILQKQPNWDNFAKDFKVIEEGQSQVEGVESCKLLSELLRNSTEMLGAEADLQVDIRSSKEFTRGLLPRQTFAVQWRVQWAGPRKRFRRWQKVPVTVEAKTTFHINKKSKVDYVRIDRWLMNGRDWRWPAVELDDDLALNVGKVEEWAKDKAMRN